MSTGTADFPPAGDLTLYEGMRRAASLGLPVLVHAENRQIPGALAACAAASSRTTMRDYLYSRPVAEREAMGRVILFAEETGCSLHVLHVSTGRSVALVAAARSRGVEVSCETCQHYLVLTDEDAKEIGALAKCAPPLRARGDLEPLWERVLGGEVAFVASDHSPSPPETKVGEDFFGSWGGISGCQSLLNAMLDEGHHERALPLARVAELVSGNVAARFGLTEKGRIEPGADADLALVDLGSGFVLGEEDLLYLHEKRPFVGRRFRGRLVRTVVRGETVFREGEIVSLPVGKLLRPRRPVGTTNPRVGRGATRRGEPRSEDRGGR